MEGEGETSKACGGLVMRDEVEMADGRAEIVLRDRASRTPAYQVTGRQISKPSMLAATGDRTMSPAQAFATIFSAFVIIGDEHVSS